MSFDYEATIANAFLDFMEEGYVPRTQASLLVPFDSTALAEAEVEYEDHVSPSIWVKFGVIGGGKNEAAKIATNVSAVIWTTTPWTIPHNRGLAFHPDYDYVTIQTEKGKLLLAADRVAALQSEGETEAEILGAYKRRDFEGHEVPSSISPIQSARSARRLRRSRSGQRHRSHRARPWHR
jgi:isoleucyl-tRNA synthetase